METKIGDILAVRINSYKNKNEYNYGSGVIYKTNNAKYDLIFTAKHCICRKDSNDCKRNCDLCEKIDFTPSKLKIDKPSISSFTLQGSKCEVFIIKDRDLAIIKTPKLDIPNIVPPFFTDKNGINKIDGWGFPQINNSSEVTQLHFKEASHIVGETGRIWLPIESNTTANIMENQDNMAGFSGAGIFSENKYLIGIYTDTQISANGKGVIIDSHINKFLADNGLETLEIEDNSQIIRTRINDEFIECFDKLKSFNIEGLVVNPFCIKLDGRHLNTELLIDRLLENIRYFALSDKENEDYERRKLMMKRDRVASHKFINLDLTEKASELFVFSFLESDMKAPKLFSGIEEDSPFKSVHLKIHNDGLYSLIHSAGSMQSDIRIAIMNCLEYIIANIDNCLTPNALISNSVSCSSYDESTYEELKKILIPTKIDIEYDMYNSFGIFIGFNIDLNDLKQIQRGYKLQLHDKINAIVSSIKKDVIEILKEQSLDEIEINLYVVPFKSVEIFSSELLNSIL